MSIDCLFCGIVQKKIPAQIIAESADSIAFLDIHPLSPGHTVVVPKLHCERLNELPPVVAGPLLLTVKQVSAIIQSTLEPDGFTIGINDGVLAGQGVAHLHVHVIPRWRGDGGSNLHSIVHNPLTESIEAIATRLKHAPIAD